jgi:hypothetical protein
MTNEEGRTSNVSSIEISLSIIKKTWERTEYTP